MVSTIPSRPTGTLMMKIQRQDRVVVRNPPTGGPSNGPIVAGISTQNMAVISSLLLTLRISTSRPTGTIIAPPAPCSSRAPTRKARPGAAAHRIEPAVNSTIAARNTVRLPYRSAARPLAGISTARLTR